MSHARISPATRGSGIPSLKSYGELPVPDTRLFIVVTDPSDLAPQKVVKGLMGGRAHDHGWLA